MDLRAQWSALSSAASYAKLPCSITTKLSCAAAGRRGKSQRGTNLRKVTMEWANADGRPKRVTQNMDLPRPPPKNKKKPWITPPKPGGFLRKLKRGPPKLRSLRTPDNGLLVPKLIPIAHQVFEAHKSVNRLIPKLMQVVPVKTCKYCTDTHVGPVGHEIATCTGPDASRRRARHDWGRGRPSDVFSSLDAYHLYDRLKTIYHVERKGIPRLPALVELCIQAGVELPEYPVLRRTRPVKAIGKRIVEETQASLFDFDEDELSEVEDEVSEDEDEDEDNQEELLSSERRDEPDAVRRILEANIDMTTLNPEEVAHVAQITLNTWETMRKGVKMLMVRYPVRVCGYCPEVHIGPRGHKVKLCGAFKHQWRAGQHGWQKATLEDLIPPKYVWHVKNMEAPHLRNQLKRYYGQAPAVVELCVQAGAAIPDEFKPMMRLDVVVPEVDEIYQAV
ncbi:hypothetical protein GOP47_0001979 [Adiantum capillus-veneris]|uniref:APO domain-containing protein n=1 Tax=Adiantum capillus-veneris TaxID=13818 RepID=A0A9D4VAM3_ADICA|nr:hypothetical protein GOP47_0001979 [Adiantum capillus-veneris]